MALERLRELVLGGLTAFILLAPLAAVAQEASQTEKPASLRIAVINLQHVSNEGAAYKSIRTQVDQYRQTLQSVIMAEEDELRKADAELARKRTILAPDAYAQERRSFEKRVVEFQRQGQKRQQNLERVHQEALKQANTAVIKIVQEFTVENRLTIVLRADTALFYASGLDITGIVLERLNKTVPSIKISKPEE